MDNNFRYYAHGNLGHASSRQELTIPAKRWLRTFLVIRLRILEMLHFGYTGIP